MRFPKPTVEQFFTPYSINTFAINDDESQLLFATNMNGRVNIYGMDLPDHYPYQFASFDENTSFIHIHQSGEYVLAGFDSDGDENYKIYAILPDGGIPVRITEGDAGDKFFFTKASVSGDRIYYTTSENNQSFLNSVSHDLNTGEKKVLHEGRTGPTYLFDVSEDELNTAYIQMFANTYTVGFVKTEDGKEYITPDKDEVHNVFDPVFTKDDEVWFITNYKSDLSYLAKYNLSTKTFAKVAGFEDESLISIKFNRHTNMMYMVTENGVVQRLYYYDLNHDQLEMIESPVTRFNGLVTARSGALYVKGMSATTPVNIYKYHKEKWVKITKNAAVGLTSDDMVEPETIRYESFDGLQIEALLFSAHEDVSNGYTIFWPHGGPQSQEGRFYRAMFQVFLNRGYNIFCPNFRGSSGYGAEFLKMVEGDWGHGPRLDNLEGVKWLFDNDISSPDRLFLVGGSYGGYMALLLHGRHPEYFKAVVDIFGVSNLFTFYHSVPEHWKPIMEIWVGNPQDDEERFKVDTPITYLDTMSKPMLVIQGAKDPRVVQEESDQIVDELRAQGRDVEYLVLADEGHGFSKKENEILVYKTMLEFLERHQ